MSFAMRRIGRRRPAVRPKAAVAALLLLGAAGGLGAWVTHGKSAPPKVELTSLHAARRARPPAPPAPVELQEKLSALAAAYKEPVGLAVTDVAQGWTAQVDGAGRYPQQSVVKVWVALAVMAAVDRGALRLDQQVLLRPEDRSVFYQPLGSHIGLHGYTTTVEDLLRRALTESDNTANDKLMELAGGAGAVSAVLAAKGVEGIGVGGPERVLQAKTAGLVWTPDLAGWRFKEARSKLPDEVRDRALDAYLAAPPDGAQPAALAQALAALKRGALLSKSSTDTLLGLMGEAHRLPTAPRRPAERLVDRPQDRHRSRLARRFGGDQRRRPADRPGRARLRRGGDDPRDPQADPPAHGPDAEGQPHGGRLLADPSTGRARPDAGAAFRAGSEVLSASAVKAGACCTLRSRPSSSRF
jgi:beta-lactamase class A